MNPLQTTETHLAPRVFLENCGAIIAEFGEETQGSGNISYVLQMLDGARFFVKTPGLRGDTRWYTTFTERVAFLRNAVRIAGLVSHPALPALLNVVESPDCPLLVYEYRTGQSLHAPRAERDNPESAYQRFRALPVPQIVAALDAVFAVHAALGVDHYVAVDFYDGSLLYDFVTDTLTICDMDNYRRGAFANEMGRMFGSSRLMAPEEWERGAIIDAQTTVFTMGRLASIFLGDGTLAREPFRGADTQHEAVCRACSPKKSERFATVAAFYEAWKIT